VSRLREKRVQLRLEIHKGGGRGGRKGEECISFLVVKRGVALASGSRGVIKLGGGRRTLSTNNNEGKAPPTQLVHIAVMKKREKKRKELEKEINYYTTGKERKKKRSPLYSNRLGE